MSKYSTFSLVTNSREFTTACQYVTRAAVGGDMCGAGADGNPSWLHHLARLPSPLPDRRRQLLHHDRRAVDGRRPCPSPRLVPDVVHGQQPSKMSRQVNVAFINISSPYPPHYVFLLLSVASLGLVSCFELLDLSRHVKIEISGLKQVRDFFGL